MGHSPPGIPTPPRAADPRGWGFTTQPSAPGGDGEVRPQGCPPPRGFRSTDIMGEAKTSLFFSATGSGVGMTVRCIS